jgi:multidrug efflux pump subunit AcrA (membrane-fusion protein)
MIDRLQHSRSKRAGRVVVVMVGVVALAAALGFAVRGELGALGEWIAGDRGAASSGAPTTFYTCSMDPSVEADHPGTCPICGMALTPVTQQERSSGVVRVATKARAMIGLDVAAVEKRTLRKRIVGTGAVVEPAPTPKPAAARTAARTAITARVYRGDASDMHPGDPVVVTSRDLPLMEFPGTVVEAGADASTALRLAVEDPERQLRPGMLVDFKLETELAPRLAVPTTAVLYAGKRRLAFVEKAAGVFEPRTLELGMSSDGLVEILDGLKEGDQVAISGTFPLAAESRIRSDGTLWGERPEPTPIKKPAAAPASPPRTPQPSNGW